MPIEYLLDSSAVLAYMLDEAGADFVNDILDRSALSAINAAEILLKLVHGGLAPSQARQSLLALRIPILPFDERPAMQTRCVSTCLRHLEA